MTVASGDAHPWPIYNARLRVVFPILDADGDLVTAATALDSELSQDQGTFADATNEATEIATSSGMYYLDLIATELDTKSTTIIVKTTSAGAKTTPMVLYPRRFPVIRIGTAQAGAATTITLDSGASATDDYYNGMYINITNNSPVNALGQARRITDYVGSTKVATVESAWGTNPGSASTFEILLPGEIAGVGAWVGTAVDDPAAVGIPDVNMINVAGTAQTAGDIIGDTNDIQARLPAALVSGRMNSSVGAVATGAIAAAAFAAGAIDAAALAADAVAEIADGVWDEDATGHQTLGTFGQAIGDPVADTNTIFKAVVSDPTGATVGVDTAAILADTGTDGVAVAAGAITTAQFAAGAINGAAVAADVTTEIWAKVIETNGSITAQQAMSIFLAALAGVTSASGATLKDPSGTSTRIAATINASQERTVMTLTPSA